MDRRRALAALGVGLTALAGCTRTLRELRVPPNATAVELPYRAGDSGTVERPRGIHLGNRDDEHHVVVLAVYEDGRRLLRRVYSLAPGEQASSGPLIAAVGYYDLRVRTVSGSRTEHEWEVSPVHSNAHVTVGPNGGLMVSYGVM